MREKLSSPFQRLRHFTFGIQGSKGAPAAIHKGPFTNIAQCMEDALDMRVKYEGLLANGQIVAGAAYDFSRSLQEMASHMEEAFGKMANQEIGNIFSSLAKAQFEMSKLLDIFSSCVSKAIIKPAQLMMDKIEEAEIMKNEYDEKRKLFDSFHVEKQKGKTKRKGSSAQRFAEECMQEQANLLNVYVQSLRHSQSESLVTQAVKYHSAHLCLFSKGLATINAVQPIIKKMVYDRMLDVAWSEDESTIGTMKEMNIENYYQDGSDINSTATLSRRLGDHILHPSGYLSDCSEELNFKYSTVNSRSAPISPLMYHRRTEVPSNCDSFLNTGHDDLARYALPSPRNGGERSVQNTKNKRMESSLTNQVVDCYGGYLEGSDVNFRSGVIFMDEDCENKGSVLLKDRRYTQSGPVAKSPSTYRKYPHSNVRMTTPHIYEQTSVLYKSAPISRSPVFSSTICKSPLLSSVPLVSELHKLPLPPQESTILPKSPIHYMNPFIHSGPLGEVRNEISYEPDGQSHSPESTPDETIGTLSTIRLFGSTLS
ncbi:hypothetical protein KP509_12G046900 [Ceratopteris richardii]|nr:hypothetical protein KP509_12G046900 [Ceratopteris richardii]KAH7423261.1 hypothetical protein KP509_12G046900 [Ceratopteris richardii]